MFIKHSACFKKHQIFVNGGKTGFKDEYDFLKSSVQPGFYDQRPLENLFTKPRTIDVISLRYYLGLSLNKVSKNTPIVK